LKQQTLVFIVIVLFLALGLSGCGKTTWIAKFTEMDELDGWVVNEEYVISDDGLFLEDTNSVTTPNIWTGDFAVTVAFELATDTETSAEVLLWLSRVPGLREDDFISFYFCEGDPAIEWHSVRADGPSCSEHSIFDQSGAIEGIMEDQINTLLLIKEGEHYTVKMNGTTAWEFDDPSYESPFSYISIASSFFGEFSVPPVLFKTIEVEYEEGNML